MLPLRWDETFEGEHSLRLGIADFGLRNIRTDHAGPLGFGHDNRLLKDEELLSHFAGIMSTTNKTVRLTSLVKAAG